MKSEIQPQTASGAVDREGITVQVRLFAMCREAAGTDALSLTLPEGATGEVFWQALIAQCPALAPFRKDSRLAVNRTYVHGEVTLKNGDEVTLIPPVSGG
ncbi:MAG: molybdopterin converting factor subunit 1 [Calditrichaeota bacterium]|nr:MAG: molybdopterin converting factor subunit 1 [Calditrichota bacterium]